jgi:chorismate dehydratase
MSEESQIPKLRMAPREPIEDMIQRVERERRASLLQIESGLENSLGHFRVGSVPFLNGAPLVRGLEAQVQLVVPSRMAQMLARDELDAALVSVVAVLQSDRYDILDGVAIASLGEVQSVLLAHQVPLEQVTEVFCDPASLTSVCLLKVLLAERGLRPEFKPLEAYARAAEKAAVLLIGDEAIAFSRAQPPHQILDLGAAWLEMTQLPFVYAVWALRRGVPNEPLRRLLLEAKAFGMETLDQIIADRTEFDYDFRKDYLSWHIHYHLGSDEKRGIRKFMELLKKHGLGPVFEPKFVA